MKTLPYILVIAALALTGCGDGNDEHHDHDHGHDHGHDHDHDHGHHHEAPHGGTLISLGDHVAHLELKLDNETGTLKIWVLDGEAEKPLRIEAKTLTLRDVTAVLDPRSSPQTPPFDLTLDAVPNDLTGESIGDSSTFVIVDARMTLFEKFTAKISDPSIPGADEPVTITYPEGNEK